MLVRLCVPLIHLTVARHLNFAASGAFLSASCAPNSASTLTPLLTGLSAFAFAMAISGVTFGGLEKYHFLAGWGWARRMVGDKTLADTWTSQTAAAPPAATSATRCGGPSMVLKVRPASPKPRAMAAKSQ